jgi:predicted negative regulator of RcsB-dependent stress response
MTEQKKISLKVLDGNTEFAEDELAKVGEFFDKFSKPIFYLLVVVAVLYFGNNFYKDAQLNSAKEGAVQLELVKNTFAELTKAVESNQAEETSKQAKILLEQLKTLNDKAKPYSDYSLLYQLLSAELQNDSAQIEKIIADPKLNALIAEKDSNTAGWILNNTVNRIKK